MQEKLEDILDIYIGTHLDHKQIVSHPCYKILDMRKLRDKDVFGTGLDDRFYSELLGLVDLAKNGELKKYVGFCHYRRYFSFFDKFPNIDFLLKDGESVIIPKPLILPDDKTMREQYEACHNIDDLDIIDGIIKKDYPEYYKDWENIMNDNIIFLYNMFIMRSEDFVKHMTFIEDILNKFVDIIGNDIYKRIEDNKDKYIKKFHPNNTAEYQYRIGGYIGERLTMLYLVHNFKRLKYLDVTVTEKKY